MWPKLALTTPNTVKDALSPGSFYLYLLNAGITDVHTPYLYSSEDRTKGSVRARQALYQLSYVPDPILYI